MLLYVDLEHHERLQQDYPERVATSLANRLKVKYRIEDISGEPCLIMRYHQVTPERLYGLNVRAMLVSGNATEFEHYQEPSLAGLRAVLRLAACPILAFCGGCQILAQTYGAEIGPIGRLPPGVIDPDADNQLAPGMIQERGYLPVQISQPHALFEGLGAEPVFFESHYWEVKAPPLGFQIYASTDKCRVQMIAHENKPIFATQFHPEFHDDDHADGRRLLENFFRCAGILP
jgi:GMP synthase (glutamine-hydrolysing)